MYCTPIESLERRTLLSVAVLAAPRIPPAITSDNSTNFMSGAAASFNVITTGNPAAKLTESGKLPSGIAFHNNGDGSATLFGTPALNAGGIYTLLISAANGAGPNSTQKFTLTVDQSPRFTSARQLTITTRAAAKFTITTTAYPAAALSESDPLPDGFSLTDNGNGTATLTDLIGGHFAPASLGNGIYNLTIDASNGFTPDAEQIFTLTVNQPPQFTSTNITSFNTDTAETFTITTAGFPAPALTERGVLPSGLALLDNGDGTADLFGTPAHFAGGSYTFLLTATNGILPATSQRFTLIIDQPPVLSSPNHAIFAAGHPAKFTVSTGGYPAALIDITGTGTLPAGLTITSNGKGAATLTGIPPIGSGGNYTFTLRANNGVDPTATQVFTLTINQPPAFTTLNHTTFTTDTPGTFTLNAGSFPTSVLMETGKLPSGIVFLDNGDGTAELIGTPSDDAGGKYTLGFIANSGPEGMATQIFTLTVAEPTTITSPPQATFTVGHAVSFKITTTGFPLPSISETGDLPNIIGLHDNGNGTASFFGKLMAGTQGTYVITLTADNHAGSVASQEFTLIVD